jgi:hypothetical protein
MNNQERRDRAKQDILKLLDKQMAEREQGEPHDKVDNQDTRLSAQ